ncbi:MAG: purine-cytosine permease family protein [Bacillota bacterium]
MSEKENMVSLEEEYASKPIPENLRRHWKEPASIYMGMTAVIACAMGGGSLISGLSFSGAIAAFLIGLTILVFLFYLPMGKIGAQEGLNTYLIGEAAFGKYGSSLATALVVTAIPCIGWYGIQVAIASQAIVGVFGWGENALLIITAILGIIFAIPAMYGMLSMAWLNYASIPVMFLIIAYGLVKSLGTVGLAGIMDYQPAQHMGLGWGINLQIGMIAVGAAFAADYTRWIRNRWADVTLSGVVGLYPYTVVLTLAGMVMAISAASLGVAQPWNIVEVMIKLGLPSIALILIFLLQWTTVITAAYSSGLALQKVFGWRRFWWTMVSAVFGIALAVSGIVNHFIGFLMILASWVTPAVAVVITEYYFVAKGRFVPKPGIYWPGVIAWFIGGLVAWKSGTFGIPAINGMVAAGLVYGVVEAVKAGASKPVAR